MMTLHHCFTWNTQGEFLKTDKEAVIASIVKTGCKIAFLQEGGVDCEHPTMGTFAGLSAGALNKRCTNYILTFKTIKNLTGNIIFDAQQRVVLSGGVAARSAVAVPIGSTLYVCWHATASSDNSCTANLFRVIDERYSSTYENIVIGGDFNASPDNITDILNHGTSGSRKRKRHGFEHRRVLKSGVYTHCGSRGKKELDFFVHLSSSHFPLSEPEVKSPSVSSSDHDPVILKWKHKI